MIRLILVVLLLSFSGCAVVKIPIKVAKVGVKTTIKTGELVGKGVKAAID